jgi:hypothetical protein
MDTVICVLACNMTPCKHQRFDHQPSKKKKSNTLTLHKKEMAKKHTHCKYNESKGKNKLNA